MTIAVHKHNIVRIKDGDQIINCTIVKMHLAHVQIKLHGKLFRVAYHMIDKLVGHELLMPNEN